MYFECVVCLLLCFVVIVCFVFFAVIIVFVWGFFPPTYYPVNIVKLIILYFKIKSSLALVFNFYK